MRRHLPRGLRSPCPNTALRPAAIPRSPCPSCSHQLQPVRHASSGPSTSSLFAPTIISDPKGKGKAKPFFITTPIFYVNASPHVGHLHSLLLSDIIARFAKLRYPDREVVFTTGTDEHGLKIQQAAKRAGKGEQAFCDEVSLRFRDLAGRAGVGYTDFIRTTEERHLRAVQHFWDRLVATGDIYKGTHEGWYSVSDESFFAPSQVTKREDGTMVAAETGNEVGWEEETNWKFRLTRHVPFLREWLSRPESVEPESQRLALLRSLDSLEDLSVSRPTTRVKWGVPVPNDSGQTIYVWVDALVNYLTVLGYPWPEGHPPELAGWPVDVHVVGKDIVKFHALHWPALLRAAGLKPPRTVLSHAHWTMGRTKMSKSLGNVVDPLQAMAAVGVDGMRWYLMRCGGSLATDADYSAENLEVHYRLLADQMGNLLARLASPRILERVTKWDEAEQGGLEGLAEMRDAFEQRMEVYAVTRACEGVMDAVADANRAFTAAAPWKADGRDPTPAVVLAWSTLRIAGILLQSVIPAKASELLDRLGVSPEKRTWEDARWTGEVDTAAIVAGLLRAREEWKGKGHLWPPLPFAKE